ncbi:CRISPR-associated protein Cas4 [endosymbiont of Riftia pachyptila]|uniref:CRISPR-associated exonuclease Cas4 n=1 Tax=endosymbiont of Riftia pachyptila (vent Ph05) TaxID=1048808 RepID=G2DHA8_9GAMM|nr:CRISPR-associated protein Cas4 [endosymbiont of Riftia pachyptila]EGV49995.1 CRISPR-associated RecB family exonuclease Cas4b [endosymbiont of Riftia pachyptila (vent Ph05)]
MRDTDIDLLPLSALQHLAYCPRQCALIHLEQSWQENRFTAEGQILHQRANSGEAESRGDLHIARSLRLHSRQLGLSGIADVVEFHQAEEGARLAGRKGYWRPYPVEYKRGRRKRDDWDRIQLCAQALCLEEMFDTPVSEGAMFYGKARRRERVPIDAPLREQTAALAEQLHTLWSARKTPPPEPGPKCDHCSLVELCMPRHGSASVYLQRMLDLP